MKISEWPIVFQLDNFRYVNHTDRLLTTGFDNIAGLVKNADIIRTNHMALALMRDRYAQVYGA